MQYLVKNPYDIAFHSNGLIEIKNSISSKLDITTGDKINFAQDKSEFYITKAEQGITLKKSKPTKKGNGFLRGYSKYITSLFTSKDNCKVVRYRIGQEEEINGIIHIPIVTRNGRTQ